MDDKNQIAYRPSDADLDDSLCCTLLSPSIEHLTPKWGTVVIGCVTAKPGENHADLVARTVARIEEASSMIVPNAYLWLSIISPSEHPVQRDFPYLDVTEALSGWDWRLQIVPAIKARLIPEADGRLWPGSDGAALPSINLYTRGRLPVPRISTVWWPPHLFLHRFERLPLPLAQRIILHSSNPTKPMRVLNLWEVDGGVIEEVCAGLEILSWTICDMTSAEAIKTRLSKLNARAKLVLDHHPERVRRQRLFDNEP